MTIYASSDLVKFGMLAETTEGTFMTSAAFPTVLTNGISPEFSSNTVEDPTVSGAGEPVDMRTNLRGLDLSFPATLRYKDLQTVIAGISRDTFPSEVTIVGSSNIDVLTAGTHKDSSTGPQLKAPTSTFDNLINYGGVTSSTHPDGGAQWLMMLVSGSAQADNNLPRRIKSVWDDTSFAYIDIDPGYVGGSASAFGAPVTGTTGESITIRVGQAARNRFGASYMPAYSALWNFSDMATDGGWQNGFGLVGNDLTLQWSGKEGATIDASWVGYGSGELVSSDPSGQGFTDSALLFSPMLIAADDLKYVAIVTATTPIVLTQFNITGFNATLAGNCAAIDDVGGTSLRTGVRRGAHGMSGSIDWHLADDPRSEQLTALGSQANNEKATIDVMFQDPDGNWIVNGWLKNEFKPTGPIPGAGGNNVDGTLEFMGLRKSSLGRSWVWQEFVAV